MSHASPTGSTGHPSLRRGRAAALGVSLFAVAALLVPATVAAHDRSATFMCVDGAPQLHVHLTGYNSKVTNTVGVWIDGLAVDSSPFTFGSSLDQTWWASPAWDAHTAVVSINAGDDPIGQNGWTTEIDLSIEACVQPTPSPTPTPTPTPSDTATPTPSDSATPTPSDTATPIPTETAPPTGSAEPSSGTPTPTGSADASSGTQVTPPATSTDGPSSGSGDGALLLVLGLMGLGTTGILVLVPNPVSRRRRR